MAVRPIYLYGNDVLRAKAKPVTMLDDEVLKLIVDMAETMHQANGIGLAATQVGAMHRVIVIDLSAVEEATRNEEGELPPPPSARKTLVLLNPEVLSQEGSWTMEEGCLSIPEIRADVERAEKIRIRFHDGNMNQTEREVDGLLARVLLHEIDHLDGVLFIDRIGAAQRALLRNRLRRIKQGEVETTYPVVATSPARHRPARVEA